MDFKRKVFILSVLSAAYITWGKCIRYRLSEKYALSKESSHFWHVRVTKSEKKETKEGRKGGREGGMEGRQERGREEEGEGGKENSGYSLTSRNRAVPQGSSPSCTESRPRSTTLCQQHFLVWQGCQSVSAQKILLMESKCAGRKLHSHFRMHSLCKEEMVQWPK